MKKGIKTLGLSLCMVASLGLLAGCGGGKENEPAVNDDTKSYTIGINQFADHPSLDNCRIGFIEGLKQEGFEEGKNVKFEITNAQADPAIANQIAQNYVSSNYDLICAIATPAAQAAYNAAEEKGIPVVYTAVSDPVAAGLTMENGAPGKTTTGTSDDLPLKEQVEMIRALLPEAKTIGIIYSTSEANSISHIEKLKGIVGEYGFELETIGINAPADIPMAVDSLLTKVDCINNLTDNTVVTSLAIILEKANAKGIPVFGSEEEQVKMGCVASESINYVDLGIQTGKMAAKVLKGEDITTMPFEVVEECEFVINSEAMKQLGIALPEGMEARDVISQ